MRNITYKKMPNCLRKYRRVRGLNQKDVARALGIKSASLVSRWEKGVCLPNPINLFKLAALYRTLVDALFIDLIRFLRQELIKKEKESLKSNR